MKMRYIAMIASVLGLGLTVALVGMVGCDKPSTSEADTYFDDNPFASLPREEPGDADLKINPPAYSITNSSQVGQVTLFSATGGRMPITWEVLSTSAGTVEVQGNGRDAVYRIGALLPNTLIARDAGGSAAIASIRGQDAPSLTILSSDAPELTFDGETILLYAQGGTAPYNWSLVYPDRGQFVHRTGNSIVEYLRVQQPDQIVLLSDGSGATAELRISQPDPTTGGSTNAPTLPLVATVTPTSLDADGGLALCKVSGGSGSYTWAVIDPFRGSILAPNTGPEVVYQRDNLGDNAVKVTDDVTGKTTYVIIAQP